MIKDELIFKWTNSDSHPGYKILALIVVALLYAFFLGAISVKSGSPRRETRQNASVIHFPSGELGRYWRLKAEEEGPFPGRLMVSGEEKTSNLAGLNESGQKGDWTYYEVKLTPVQMNVGTSSEELSEKGRKYLPDRTPDANQLNPELDEPIISESIPILIPYDVRSKGWMPESLPEYESKLNENAVPATWRFILSLRPDGSVDQCLSLNGEGEPGLDAMLDWLKQVRFQNGAGERWLGLRVEFVNR